MLHSSQLVLILIRIDNYKKLMVPNGLAADDAVVGSQNYSLNRIYAKV